MNEAGLSDALLIIDLQNGVCYGETQLHHLDELIIRVNQKIECYHKAKRTIIFVQHSDADLVKNTQSWSLIPKLQTEKGTHFVQKQHANSFYQTDLDLILKKHQVQTIEICGAQTEYCIDATIKMAHGLGYRLFLEKSLTSTYDNDFMSAPQTIGFYEGIWAQRFLTLV